MNLVGLRKPRAVAAAAIVLAIVAAPAVLADSVRVDGDGVAPVDEVALDLGVICLGDIVTDTVLVAITAGGHPGSGAAIYADGASVSVTVTSTVGQGLSASNPATPIALPADWMSRADGTVSPAVESSVSFMPAGTGPFEGTVEFSASGPGTQGGMLTLTDTLAVSAEVMNCVPSPSTVAPSPTAPATPAATPTPRPTPVVSPTQSPTATATPDGTPPSTGPTPSPRPTQRRPPNTATLDEPPVQPLVAGPLLILIGLLTLTNGIATWTVRRDA